MNVYLGSRCLIRLTHYRILRSLYEFNDNTLQHLYYESTLWDYSTTTQSFEYLLRSIVIHETVLWQSILFCVLIVQVPQEALDVLQEYADLIKARSKMLEMIPPGQVILLRALKVNGERKSWDAVWVKAEELIREGILISPSMANDHYALTLQVFNTLKILWCTFDV